MPGMWLFPVTSLLGGWCVELLEGGANLLCQTMWSRRPPKHCVPHGRHGEGHVDQVGYRAGNRARPYREQLKLAAWCCSGTALVSGCHKLARPFEGTIHFWPVVAVTLDTNVSFSKFQGVQLLPMTL